MTASVSVVLAAHGAPGALDSIESLAAQLRTAGLAERVLVGFLRGEPALTHVLRTLPESRIVVVPLFTSEGHFTDRVLPEAVRVSGRHVRITRAIGAHPRVPGLVAERVRAALSALRLDPAMTGVCVVGHGTRRHPSSRATTLDVVEAVAASGVAASAVAAFLDDDPMIDAAVSAGDARDLLVVPFLIGGGRHAVQDLPFRLGKSAGRPNQGRILLDEPFGTYPEVAALIEEVVRDALAVTEDSRELTGAVFLVGAGPGDPGLLTVKGLAVLRRADVVVYDRLVAPELLAECRAGAELIDGGHRSGGLSSRQGRVNRVLIARARAGRVVVRLKGGDPFVFGRGWEELAACAEAGVRCEVIPGVSSATGVPAAAGIPLTSRGMARSVAVVTGQTEQGSPFPDEQLQALAALDTIVLLMGRASLAEFAGRLIAAGRAGDTPVTSIQRGTLPEQRICRATLATIAEAVDRAGLGAPLLTVIGAVAGLGLPVVSAHGTAPPEGAAAW